MVMRKPEFDSQHWPQFRSAVLAQWKSHCLVSNRREFDSLIPLHFSRGYVSQVGKATVCKTVNAQVRFLHVPPNFMVGLADRT